MAKKAASKKTTKPPKKAAKNDAKEPPSEKSTEWQEKVLKKVIGIGKKAPSLKQKTEDEVIEEFKSILELEYKRFPKAKYPSRTDIVYWKRSFAKFRNRHKKLVRSPATWFMGKVLGARESRDMMEKMINTAMELASNNEKKALRDGVIMFDEVEDEDTGEKTRVPKLNKQGQYIPRDARRTFPKAKDKDGNPKKNPRYGKELESSWTRPIILIAAPEDDSGPVKLARLELRGTKAMPDALKIPVNKNVRFLALDRTPDNEESEYVLRSSNQTEFELLPDDHLPSLADLYKSDILAEVTSEPDELEVYHDDHGFLEDGKPNWDNIVITRGDVMQLSLEKTRTGNIWCRLEKTTIDGDIGDIDDGFGDLEDDEIPDSTMVWIPEHLIPLVDFGEDSVVYVTGRTGRMESRDEQGNPLKDEDTEEPLYDPVSVTAYGIWADPEYKEDLEKKNIEEYDDDEVEGEDYEPEMDEEEGEDDEGEGEGEGEDEDEKEGGKAEWEEE